MKAKILDDIKVCSYPNNMKESIANVILEIVKMTKNAHLNKFGKQNGIVTDFILLVKCKLNVPYKDRSYDIPISIILPKSYPFDPPEFYLDKLPEFGLNPKNTDIDQNTFRILVNCLKNWDIYNNSNILRVLQEIINSFNHNFPIYQITLNNPLYQQPQPLVTNESWNSINSTFNSYGESIMSQNHGGTINIKNKSISPLKYDVSSSCQIKNSSYNDSNQNIKMLLDFNRLDDNSLRRIMIDELRFLLEPKIRDESKKLKQQWEKLYNYKNEFCHQNDKLQNFVEKKEYIFVNVNSSLQNIQIEINVISHFIQTNKNKTTS